MIEKLIWIESDTQLAYIANEKALEHKINELVDAVNELQKHEEQHLDLLTQLNKMRLHQNKTPVDPYAEQRKWIGKACWFWNNDYDLKTIGVFEEITTIEGRICYTKKDTRAAWEHCEPVKPDDDIIYKGGDNE